MTAVHPSPVSTVTPRDIARFGVTWDAELFCRSPHWLLDEDKGVSAGDVREGERLDLAENPDQTAYRPGQIGAFRLLKPFNPQGIGFFKLLLSDFIGIYL